jgi:RHS repeat-associated protein
MAYTYNAGGTPLKRTLDGGSWTVYIAGVFEKTNTGAVRKYYAAAGKTIAVRDGAGTGTLSYPLHDHLGSTSEITTTAGTVASSMRYWPYGGTRTGGVTGTDLLYTGQRQEAGDAQMGLYNYKARFYSTALGRFLSADPVGGGSARYQYVRSNPIILVDPTGFTAFIVCGTANNCDEGQDIGGYENLIVAEWIREGRYPGASDQWLRSVPFRMLLAAMQQRGFNGQQSVRTFGVAFMDSTAPGDGGYWDLAEDVLDPRKKDLNSKVDKFLFLERLYFGPWRADLWVGYSWGGRIVYDALNRRPDRLPTGAILIEPGIGTNSKLPSSVLHTTRVITWSDYDPSPIPKVHGWIEGAYYFQSDDCGGLKQHCTHGPHQAFMVDVARTVSPERSETTRRIMSDMARQQGVSVLCIPEPGRQFCN